MVKLVSFISLCWGERRAVGRNPHLLEVSEGHWTPQGQLSSVSAWGRAPDWAVSLWRLLP